MDRSKRVIFTSHCILNQNTVVYPLARAQGAYSEIIKTIMDKGIGIHQLPCPEYRHLGIERKPLSKSEYDTKEFRDLCKDISQDAVNILKEYLHNDYEIIGLIGINQSPSCSIRDIRGILMEELLTLVESEGISLNTIDVSDKYRDGKDNKEFLEELETFLETK